MLSHIGKSIHGRRPANFREVGREQERVESACIYFISSKRGRTVENKAKYQHLETGIYYFSFLKFRLFHNMS